MKRCRNRSSQSVIHHCEVDLVSQWPACPLTVIASSHDPASERAIFISWLKLQSYKLPSYSLSCDTAVCLSLLLFSFCCVSQSSGSPWTTAGIITGLLVCCIGFILVHVPAGEKESDMQLNQLNTDQAWRGFRKRITQESATLLRYWGVIIGLILICFLLRKHLSEWGIVLSIAAGFTFSWGLLILRRLTALKQSLRLYYKLVSSSSTTQLRKVE